MKANSHSARNKEIFGDLLTMDALQYVSKEYSCVIFSDVQCR